MARSVVSLHCTGCDAIGPRDGVIGRPSLWIAEDFVAEVCNAVLQCLLQHEGEEAARHVTADRLVELVEDRAGGEQALRCALKLSTIVNCL